MPKSVARMPQLESQDPRAIRRWLQAFGAAPAEADTEANGWPLQHPHLQRRLSGGALPPGMLAEAVSPRPGSGGQMLLDALISSAVRQHAYLALIDGADTFDAASIPEVFHPFILWVRCRHTREALRAADILIRDENFPLLVIDLRQCIQRDVQRVPNQQWYRLHHAARHQNSTSIVLTRRASVAAAQLRLELSARFALETFFQRRSLIWEHTPVDVSRQRHMPTPVNARSDQRYSRTA